MLHKTSTHAGAQRPRTAGSPPPRQAIGLATAIVESLFGRRPLHHLRQHLSANAFESLAAGRESGQFLRSTIGSWRCQMPTSTAAEVCIRVSLHGRWLVCVMRLDLLKQWRCSEFHILGA
ncbi:Rv3235 family protein [uncultured Tessaracoccus sp.]|uniref:Rv3235 family protein n=1 Tax=uncultured Tessaracoccus sp. TaxID=905023 RepID=UPI00342161D1